ncbi:ribosomal RNA large subunit methyltransferase J [Saprolegnia diclina VS20]|uniref:rRNA methyltransferase 2, mitochondrial n=1 Tax=Saprolegnia diclina (strain VS20) TaxID=1156394 RepID=T0QP94_SAPDV|nr:ribosomal RNA large subunit methyltransferase J [Saprolegnia diclina VS20]EQC35680.1 ribosomal RNA large subunit methyltransferase J [Saprolegnia diclina VS20]|eukprot:XP_008610997.1 ribosomal RNA large subunit methyltransferase J [Saprolegnia diclina VS20]
MAAVLPSSARWLSTIRKGKSVSSARWLNRQQNDHIVKQAKREGLRSRAALKLREINAKFNVVRKGNVVIDLGAAPGGWTQIAIDECRKGSPPEDPEKPGKVNVIAIDLLHFVAFPGVGVIVGDFRKPEIQAKITEYLAGRQADVVLSDMAPSFSGLGFRDSEDQLRLCQNALRMAQLYLKPGGRFVSKVLRSPAGDQFRQELKPFFEQVKAMKPESSRPESTEIFFVGLGFKRQDETQ